jgi:N-methylhydantoinase B
MVPPGERLIIQTPGGAGIGDPASRPRAAVASDLRDGLVTAETAARLYGATAAAAE